MVLYHRRKLVVHAGIGALVVLLFLPWVLLLPWAQNFFERVSDHGLSAGAPVGERAAGRAGVLWESIPYTFFAYSSGFSTGPSVAELHENKSMAFLLQFAPEIAFVAVIFGALFLIGVYAIYKLHGGRPAFFCLLVLSLPILGTLLYGLAPRATYNVRYTIMGFPFFCIFVGTGLVFIFQKYRPAGAAFSLGVLIVCSVSLGNHYFDPRYAKEDIRSAVTFWRASSNQEPLLSYRAQNVLSVYLSEPERQQHLPLGPDVISEIARFFLKTEAPSIYILLARDWGGVKEHAIREAYVINREQSFPGVQLLKISAPRNARSDSDSDLHHRGTEGTEG
jgi:hypothetical protein